ncbi:POC1 centriolar protein homolog B isoform X3 [Synchiropus splendidus]|uniref:POC1 centriolar protein homolog B isoform X3 n=1 Tax=Synchiropus splendidus TaxID=270530 RepID=UPI00237D97B5|nr:POC1 centriolar protein homolog B isoform X3 [Synchiropus splendidus]
MASVMDDPTLERYFTGHKDDVTCADFNSNCRQLATGSVDKSLMIWNLAPKGRAFRFISHQDAITAVQFSPTCNLVATSSKDKTVRLWTPTIKGDSSVFKAHTAAVRSVAFSHNGHKLVTASDDKSVKVWSVHRKCFVYSLNQHTNWVRSARFSPDGRLIASCGDDRSVRLWDTSSKHCINCFSDYGGAVTFVDFNSSGTCIASASADSSLKIWDLRTNKLIQHYQVHSAQINSLSFHPSNNFLISGSSDCTIKILDLLEGRLIYTLHGHKGAVLTVAFSKAGDLFASGGADGQVLMWRTNFDTKSYKDVLVQHSRRSTPDLPPHLTDIHPRVPHLHHPQASSIQHSGTQSPSPEQAHRRLSEAFVKQHVADWTADEHASSSVNQTGHAPIGRAAREQGTSRPAEKVSSGPSSGLTSTLQHIVRQLDILTQTVSVLEERLTLTEDKLKECLDHQTHIINKGADRNLGRTVVSHSFTLVQT